MCATRCDMKTKGLPKTVRRSVALSRQLVEQVSALAPPELRQNLNRLVTVALQEFAAHQKARVFEDSIAKMGRDPGLPIDTVFLCFQIRSLDTARFFDPKTHRPNLAGTIPPARMAEVEGALRLVLNL